VVPKELFASYVKSVLANLYDPCLLQTHPLVSLLVPQHIPTETNSQCLRQIVLEAIETLRPAGKVPFGRPEWLGYRILWLRYVDCLSQPEVCQELGLGRTAFYDAHRQALDAVVSVLWNRYRDGSVSTAPREESAPSHTTSSLAQEEAVRVASTSLRQAVNLTTVLDGARQVILPLAQRRGVDLAIKAPTLLPDTFGDLAILRQIILNIMTELVSLTTSQALRLTVSVTDDNTVWQLCGWSELDVPQLSLEQLPGIAVSRELLRVYGGHFWVETSASGMPTLGFALPVAKPKTILIIDDSDDALTLYQRYLQSEEYALRVACNGEQVQRLLAETRPDLVLLDVLMPQQDGWDILQRLKTMPEMAHIPVVICSVLSQPQLALALGAAQVLQKPIDQATLLQTVQELLAQADTAHPEYRAEPASSALL
jgi:CheY-like chemotaxis protein